MTDDELQAIKARADAATPGPWTVGVFADKWCWPTFRLRDLGDPNPEGVEVQADARFIAAARDDVPALVAEVDRLRRLLFFTPPGSR